MLLNHLLQYYEGGEMTLATMKLPFKKVNSKNINKMILKVKLEVPMP